MGTQVTAPNYSSGKAANVVAAVAGSAPPAIAAGEAAIFVGDDIYYRGTEIVARLQQCIDAAREFDFAKRASAENVNTVLVNNGKGAISVLTGATIAAISESNVAIMWDETFAAAGSNGLFITAFEHMRETLMELQLKVS